MPIYRLNIPVDAVEDELQKHGDGFHVQIQIDENEPSQDSWDDLDGNIYSANSEDSQENWVYLDDGVWKPIPAAGVPWKGIGESYTVRWRTKESIGLADEDYNLRMRTYNGTSYSDPYDTNANFAMDLISKSFRTCMTSLNFWNFGKV